MAMLDTLGCLSNSQRIYHRPYSVLSSDPNLGCQTHIGSFPTYPVPQIPQLPQGRDFMPLRL